MPDLSIIIVTYNSEEDIGRCLDSILATKGNLDLEVFVVDNASKDRTVEIVRTEYPWVRLLANDFNAGFPGGNNQAIPLASGRYVMLLNPDTIVLEAAFEKIVGFMDSNPDCGVCGPVLLDVDGNITAHIRRPTAMYQLLATFRLQRFLRSRLPPKSFKVVSGACLCMRRTTIENIGMLDEELFWCEDVDYCTRVLASGERVCEVPGAKVIHVIGQSAKSNPSLHIEKQYVSKIRYCYKHESRLQLRLLLLVLILQATFRWGLWIIRGLCGSSKQAAPRIRTFRSILPQMTRVLLSPTCSLDAITANPSNKNR